MDMYAYKCKYANTFFVLMYFTLFIAALYLSFQISIWFNNQHQTRH